MVVYQIVYVVQSGKHNFILIHIVVLVMFQCSAGGSILLVAEGLL